MSDNAYWKGLGLLRFHDEEEEIAEEYVADY